MANSKVDASIFIVITPNKKTENTPNPMIKLTAIRALRLVTSKHNFSHLLLSSSLGFNGVTRVEKLEG